jgi:hypothetical protein
LEKFLTLIPHGVEWISPHPEILPGIERNAITQAPHAIASMIARVAMRRGTGEDPAAIEANYVRRSDAELLFKLAK